MIFIKSEKEIQLIRDASKIVARVFDKLNDYVRPGVTTENLNQVASQLIAKEGGSPAFLGYRGFPAAICSSINDEVVHGIPSLNRKLEEGNIVSIDIGVKKNGYFGDAAYTFPIGDVSENARRLIEVTREALYLGIKEVKQDKRLFDLSCLIQKHAEANGFSVVRDYVGHGIGASLHEDPQIPNFGEAGKGPRLKTGMVLAIEPMINEGAHRVRTLDDKWTVVTVDGKLSAHFEHTVAVEDNGYEILTAL